MMMMESDRTTPASTAYLGETGQHGGIHRWRHRQKRSARIQGVGMVQELAT